MTGLREANEPEAPSPSLTAAAITHYTAPGELIIDLACGSGHTLIEAIRADRLAIGVERSRRLAQEAREAVAQATAHGGPGFAAVVVGKLADVAKLVGPDSLGRVSLVLVDMARVGVLGEHSRVTKAEALERLTVVLDICRALLRPDGHLLVSVRSGLLNEAKTAIGASSTFDIVEDLRDGPTQVSAIAMRYVAGHAR